MIFLRLFWGFLRVGLFSFGGAYTAIPLISDVVEEYQWLSAKELSYMIAVSESTPGPLMVNLATYIGSVKAGLPGAALATFAVILPPFAVILLVMFLFRALLKSEVFRAALAAMKPCICGIILMTGFFMILNSFFYVEPYFEASLLRIDLRVVAVTAILALVLFLPELLWKKKLSPILFIGISAVLGVVVWGFFP